MAHSYVIASNRPWNRTLADRLSARTGASFLLASAADALTPEQLATINPRYVFLVHWSARIPDAVWAKYECVVFHMTDLPYGRGGSPLQNLIERGHDSTVVCALRCTAQLDAGPIYLKRPLSLAGSAEEIFIRADRVIEEMIFEILRDEPQPVAQSGEPVIFKRRKPQDSDLRNKTGLKQWYDSIRMMDAQGYPAAFIDVGELRIEFRRVSERVDGLSAEVVIRERAKNQEP